MNMSRLLLKTLILAVCNQPAMAASPTGSPSLSEIEIAAQAPLGSNLTPGAGLSPLLDGSGGVVTLESTDGAYAGVYYDGGGNTIIAYQYSQRTSQANVAIATLTGDDPSASPAYKDALAFAKAVISLTTSQGRPLNQVYVTGFF